MQLWSRFVAVLLIVSLLSCASFAVSDEVVTQPHNFWQEADIVFFQTLPFAAFWGHFLDQQLSGQLAYAGVPHWNAIVGFAVVVSAVNAKLYAGKVSDKVSVDNAK